MRGKSISLLSVLALLTVLAIAVIWTQIVPQYQAQGAVRIKPIIPYLVFKTEDSGMIPLYESFVNTQVNIMTSSQVLVRVLDQTEVKDTQWYKDPPKSIMQRLGETPPTRMERLRDGLSVKPRRQTEIVDISFIATSSKDAKVIADAVLDDYLKYTWDKSYTTSNNIYRELAQQYDTLKRQIQDQELRCAALRRSLGTQSPEVLISNKRARLDETQTRHSELQQRITVLEWDRKRLEDLMKRDIAEGGSDVAVAPAGSAEQQPKYHEDKEWRERDVKVRTICHNIATSQLDPSDPEILQAKKDLKLAEELLRLREAQLDEQWRDRPKDAAGVPITIAGTSGPGYEEALTSMKQQLDRAKYEKTLVLAEFESQKTEFKGLFKGAEELERENNLLLEKQELFSAVRRRRDQKTMERNVPTGSIEELTRALASSKPYNDRRILFTAIALGLCLVVGCGIVFLQRTRTGDGGKGRR
jgi:uncharacterized protein involved in exopolysaccharide biosynthesis